MPAFDPPRQPKVRSLRWLSGVAAERLIRLERRELQIRWKELPGRFSVCVSASAEGLGKEWEDEGAVVLHWPIQGGHLTGHLRAEPGLWPIAGDHIQRILLFHVLESAAEPAPLFAEAARVLAPEGRMLVVLLNPYSPWAVRWLGRGPAAISFARMRRWARRAGLEIVQRYGLGPCWPWSDKAQSLRCFGRDLLAPWHASYAVVVRKRRLAPILPFRRPALSLSPRTYPG